MVSDGWKQCRTTQNMSLEVQTAASSSPSLSSRNIQITRRLKLVWACSIVNSTGWLLTYWRRGHEGVNQFILRGASRFQSWPPIISPGPPGSRFKVDAWPWTRRRARIVVKSRIRMVWCAGNWSDSEFFEVERYSSGDWIDDFVGSFL